MSTAARTEPAIVTRSDSPTALEWAAISVAAKKFDRKKHVLTPGRGQKVDLTLRIFGDVDVGLDSAGPVREKPEHKLLLGYILGKLGPMTAAALCAAIRAEKDGLPPIEAELADQADELVEHLTVAVPQKKRGPITGALVVTVIDQTK